MRSRVKEGMGKLGGAAARGAGRVAAAVPVVGPAAVSAAVLAVLLALPAGTARGHEGRGAPGVEPAGGAVGPRTFAIREGFFREIALGGAGSGPAIVSVDTEDTVWVAVARTGQLGRFQNGRLDLFDLGADSRPVGLVAGRPDNGHAGAVWIAAAFDDKLVRFDVATRTAREFALGGDASWPFNIALAPSGAVWFSQRAAGRVGRLDPGSGEIVHYDPPTPGSGPAGLAVDPRTGAVWFTESYADRIARLDPMTGDIREYVMGEESSGKERGPAGLAVDAEGGVWFAKLEGALGHLPPGGDSLEIFRLPPAVRRPAGVAVGPRGEVWVAALDGNQLVRWDPKSRDLAIFPIPTGEPDPTPAEPPAARTSRPFGIAVDSGGNVWFSQQYTGQLAVLDVEPPRVEVLSPGPRPVAAASVLVTLRATDRVAGVERIELRLDGRRVVPEHGRLFLADLPPGRKQLEVRAVDHAGNESRTVHEIDYRPSHLALLELLRGLEPRNEEGETRLGQLLAAARRIPKQPRPDFAALRAGFEGGAGLFRHFPGTALERVVDALDTGGARSVEVEILDRAPFFVPARLELAPGDTVRWAYDPPSDGHSISHRLHRIEIAAASGAAGAAGAVRSPLLRAGEGFAHTFERSGTFEVRDGGPEAGPATMEVVVGEGAGK